MKRRGSPSVNFTGSRNANYYMKRIRKNDSEGSDSIKKYFRLSETKQNSENKSDEINSTVNENNNVEKISDSSPDALIHREKPDPTAETCSVESAVSDNLISTVEPISVTTEIDPRTKDKVACSSVSNDLVSPSTNNGNLSENIEKISCPESTRTKVKNAYPKNICNIEKSFPWIYFSVSANGFLCKICSLIFKNGPWCDRGINFLGHPTRCIKKHENSKKHKDAMNSFKSTQGPSILQKIDMASKKVEEETRITNRKLLVKFIKVLYFMIKKHWAISENFESMIKFIGNDLGDPEINSYLKTCAKNATYLSNTSVSNIMRAISLYFEEKIITEIICAGEYALMADESTDEAQREQLGLILRYKMLGVADIKEEFLGIINLGSTNSESITSAIEKFLVAKGIKLSNCLFIALDGANVMSGETSGVQRRIKLHSPHSIYVNCRNHRLALVFVHLLKKYDYLKSVDSILVSLWKMFHYSPGKSQVFKDIQGEVYNIKTLKILKVSVTRWLSHGKACERVIMRYQQLVQTLDTLFVKTREPVIKGIREQLLNPQVLLTLLFLSDFLDKVDKLNLWLQSPHIAFSSVSIQVNKLLYDVRDLVENLQKGKFFNKSLELLSFAQEHTTHSRNSRYSSIQPDDHTKQLDTFKETFVAPFFKDFEMEIGQAFLISDSCAPLNGFDVFSGKNISGSNDDAWQTLLSFYGDERTHEFKGVKNSSNPLIDATVAKSEIIGFEKEMASAKLTFEMEKLKKAQQLIKEDKQDLAKKKMEETIESKDLLKILESSGMWSVYPNCMKLLSLSSIIPSSTASVERLFSQMNLICTDLRSRMTQQSLDMHLRIILNGPDSLSDI